jgi:uncharacterized protein DUF732
MKLPATVFRALLPIMAAAALGAELTACASSSSSKAAPLTSARAASTESAPPSPASTLTARQLQFATDVRNALGFGSSVQDGALADFGQHVCRTRQAGGTVAAEVKAAQQVQKSISKGDAVQMIVIAEKDLCPAQSTPQQVTYVVTGSAAHVTYGPSGSNFEGTGPLSVSQPLGQPQFYSINAQLTGGGTVTCLLKVDGVTIVSNSASGNGNIASCQMDQNLNGSWEPTTGTG